LKLGKWTKYLLICGFIVSAPNLSAQTSGSKGSASAAQPAQPAAGKGQAAATAKPTEPKTVGRLFPDKEYYSKQEVEALQKVLNQKANKLDQDIETQKEYLQSLDKEVEDHLQKIQQARNEIADFMNARDQKEETKLKKLAKFYEAMDAEQAAPLLERINNNLAIKLFDRMDTKKAGAILALFPPQRAASITSNFPRLKLQADGGGARN